MEIRCPKSMLNVAERAKKGKNRYISGFRACSGRRGRRFKSCHPDQQKSHFCLPTKVRFLNDVCLRQMMLALPMMTLSLMMCALRHITANITSLRGKTSNIIMRSITSYRYRRCFIENIEFYGIISLTNENLQN